MSTSPNHPTLIYITRLLHYSGYASIVSYLVALLVIKPLLQNKSRLLQSFYLSNIKSLNKLYQSLTRKFNVVPSLLVTYNTGSGKQYSDATVQTDNSISAIRNDPIFNKSSYVTTCAESLKSVGELNEKLENLHKKLTKHNSINYVSDLNFRLTEFNSQLQSDRLCDGRVFDKNKVGEEIRGKIRKMKGTILSN
ncbi:hypothetical protein DASC09_017480 [Saccharomycopsis crataegensis]|uniref:Peroxin-14 n=1 Tax=Saccharomycopsis crataegensis TaxID=43959 RepID=A0AAV5QJV3_9ASCO|nr:hypothetical protein DASC09_017480 [Saccharomycopsis crataegensis]